MVMLFSAVQRVKLRSQPAQWVARAAELQQAREEAMREVAEARLRVAGAVSSTAYCWVHRSHHLCCRMATCAPAIRQLHAAHVGAHVPAIASDSHAAW
jgi:hypothetical protein